MDSMKISPSDLEKFIKEENDQECFSGSSQAEEPSIMSYDDAVFKYKEEPVGKTALADIDATYSKEKTEEITVYVEHIICDTPQEELNLSSVKCETAGRHDMPNHATFECNFCQRYFSEEKLLIKHIEGHTKQGIGNIKHDRNAHCQRDIELSSRVQTEVNSFRCEQGDKRFTTSSGRAVHNRIDTGETPFKCEQCGKCFPYPSNLTRHNRTHTGEKPFKCEHCGKCLTNLYSLKRHEKIHTGQKPYKCEKCGKCFRSTPELTKHKRTHGGEKPYRCEQCGKGFSRPSQLNMHNIVHACQKYDSDVFCVMFTN